MICTLSKHLAAVDELFAFVERFVAGEQIDAETAFQLTVAAEELFTNQVKYGAANGVPVALTLTRQGDWVELRLEDFGVPAFDITTAELPDLDVPIEQRRAGGMGLHLVRGFADELTYCHAGGNSIIMFRKRIGVRDVQHSG